MVDMKNKIKNIVKLPDSSKTPEGRNINWYHIYFQEPGFGVEPKGALIEEKEVNDGAVYTVKPLGFTNASNIFYGTLSLENKKNEAKEFFDWVSKLEQNEIRNLIYGRELLKG